MPYTPKYLTLYKRPRNYIGPDYDGYYPFLGQSRDSDALERSNFAVGLARLGGESETVLVIRDSHWAVGWVETIYVDASDETAVRLADEMRGKLADYPVLDEDDWSTREWEEASEWWESMGLTGRVEACQRAGISVFAARRLDLSSVPDDDGRLQEYLLGH